LVSPDEVQAALIAALKANAALVAALKEGASGIREAEWKGTAFEYPNVRLGRIVMTPYGDGNCTPHSQRVTFNVMANSKLDSSKTAQTIQGLILDALDGLRISATGFVGMVPIRLVQQMPASPDPNGLWTALTNLRTIVKEK
jgi:hypothetical protein